MIVLTIIFSILALFAFNNSMSDIEDGDISFGIAEIIVSILFLFIVFLSVNRYTQKKLAMDENRQQYEKVVYYESIDGRYVATDSTVVLKD